MLIVVPYYTYKVSVSHLAPLASYVQNMYCLGLFSQELHYFQYDVTRRVSEPHIHAKCEGLVLFSLLEEEFLCL